MFITYKFHIVNSRWVFAKLFSFFVAQSLYKTQFLFLVCNLGEYLDLLAYVKSLSGSNKCRYIVGEFIFFYIHSIFYLFSQKKKILIIRYFIAETQSKNVLFIFVVAHITFGQ